jgi:hypothetical protein
MFIAYLETSMQKRRWQMLEKKTNIDDMNMKQRGTSKLKTISKKSDIEKMANQL